LGDKIFFQRGEKKDYLSKKFCDEPVKACESSNSMPSSDRSCYSSKKDSLGSSLGTSVHREAQKVKMN